MTINETQSASSADTTQTQTSSTDAAQATAPQDVSPATQDANTQLSADPSSAGDKSVAGYEEAKPKSLLDVVKNVVVEAKDGSADGGKSLDPNKTDETSKATEAKKDDSQTALDGDKQSTDEADDAKLPFHKHPRFQQVIQERSAFKKELESAKPDAEEWRAVRSYMDSNSLTPQEVAKGFEIMAAMKSNPLQAREMLSQYWNSLEEFAGNRLPKDLKEKVDGGEVDEAVAAELARRRNEADFLRGQQEIQAQRQAQEAAYQQQAITQSVMRNAVVDWENGIKTRDADYSVKAPFLMDKVRAAMASTPPQTPQQALALVENAYKEVSETLRRFVPQRQAATTIKSETSSASVRPQPKNLRDAIRLAAAGQI